MCAGDHYFSVAHSRPDKLAFFQAFGKQAQTISIGPEDFYSISLAATEDKQMAGERILIKSVLYQLAQAINDLRMSVTPATSQIRVPEGRVIIDFSRSVREAVQPATLVTGSPASFYRSGTRRSRRRRSALRTEPVLCSPRQMELDQVPPQQAVSLVSVKIVSTHSF